MPELPEVETVRAQLGPLLDKRRVVDAWAFDSAKFTEATEVTGVRFGSVRRRGKYLLLPTDDGRELVVHLGMTGSLRLTATETTAAPTTPNTTGEPHGSHLRAWWRLEGATGSGAEYLRFDDVRRFGRLRVVATGDYDSIPTLANMGPEPFDPAFDGDVLWERLRRSRRRLKTQLLSQRPVAGVGNIYADEALWLARINPSVTSLSRARATRLLEALRNTLAQGIANGGTTFRDFRDSHGDRGSNQEQLKAYGRKGLPCRRCGCSLVSTSIDNRSTIWCPTCQRY